MYNIAAAAVLARDNCFHSRVLHIYTRARAALYKYATDWLVTGLYTLETCTYLYRDTQVIQSHHAARFHFSPDNLSSAVYQFARADFEMTRERERERETLTPLSVCLSLSYAGVRGRVYKYRKVYKNDWIAPRSGSEKRARALIFFSHPARRGRWLCRIYTSV